MEQADKDGIFDIVVIGAGVVGCAVARRFTLAGARVLILEKGGDILSGASKANSAILHTAFDAPPGSLEWQCMQAGYQEYLALAERMNLPVLETGAVVAAWNEDEYAKLDEIAAQAHLNGVTDVCRIDRQALLAKEPHLSPAVTGGLWVPREHVIDPWSAPLAYMRQAVENGAVLRVATALTGAQREQDHWRLTTSKGDYQARSVINCAGLYGDTVEAIFLGQSSFSIRPRKGQFVVFDKAAAALLQTILLPVPTERTKGVVLVRTIFGNLLVGPTAEEQTERQRAAVDETQLQGLIANAVQRIPALQQVPVTAVYAGLRPATEEKAYRVHSDAQHAYIALGGVRSTGLTAALGLASHALKLWHAAQNPVATETQAARGSHIPPIPPIPLAAPSWPVMPNLAEHRPRDWERAGDNEIICHCERVTRREIEDALQGPVPARDFGGLRRRTRACMGRCQGFYCGAAVARLSAGHFETPLAVGVTHE